MVKIDLEEMGMVVQFEDLNVVNDMDWGKSKRDLILGI
jgi:hypothetical protein